MEKQKRRLLIFAFIAFLVVFIVFSCDLFPGIPGFIKGTGIWGKSKYGEAVFAGDKRGILEKSLHKEENDLWK